MGGGVVVCSYLKEYPRYPQKFSLYITGGKMVFEVLVLLLGMVSLFMAGGCCVLSLYFGEPNARLGMWVGILGGAFACFCACLL